MKTKTKKSIKVKLPKYDLGGDTGEKKKFNMDIFSTIGNAAGAASGGINSELSWKQNPTYSVSENPVQKGIETGLGSTPITSAFMGIGKAGEGIFDSIVPGLGESIFSPHKKYIRAVKEGKPQYMIPVAGSIIAAADSKKQLEQEQLENSRQINPYGESYLKYGGALIQYDAPSHENGGQMITSTGAVTNNPNKAVAEIEKKETMHNGYVFSDTLKTPSGKTFAAASKAIENRFKSKDDPISEKTRKLQLELLKSQNETTKAQVESTMPMMQNGGDPIKGQNNFTYTSGGLESVDSWTDNETAQENWNRKSDDFYQQRKLMEFNLKAEGINPNDLIKSMNPNYSYSPGTKFSSLSEEYKNLIAGQKQHEGFKPNTLQIKACGGKIKKMNLGGDPTKPGQEITPATNPSQILAGDIFFNNSYLDGSMFNKPENPNQVTPLVVTDNYADNQIIEEGAKPILTTKEKPGMDYLTPARIGKGMELAGKAGILSAGYDKVKPELNPQAKKVADLMRNKINFQSLLNEINLQTNAALAGNRDARSLNVKRALDQRALSAAAKAAMNAKLQEQTQNNAYRQQEAQVLSQLGSEEARAKVYAEDATARNKGQWLTNLGTVLGDVGRAGEFETKVKVNDMQVAESLAMLGMKYEDFGVDAETYKRLKQGKYTLADVEKLQEGLIKYKQNGK